MPLWKMPPRAKVFEALTAIVDGRVSRSGTHSATVKSSDGSKTYSVAWSTDFRQITSNDNGSYWQRCLGYPIIAVLLELGKLPFDANVARPLSGVPWNRLNAEHKRDYELVISKVLHRIGNEGADTGALCQYIDQILTMLPTLGLEQLPKGKKPPAASSASQP
jgi:hypothetical protein